MTHWRWLARTGERGHRHIGGAPTRSATSHGPAAVVARDPRTPPPTAAGHGVAVFLGFTDGAQVPLHPNDPHLRALRDAAEELLRRE